VFLSSPGGWLAYGDILTYQPFSDNCPSQPKCGKIDVLKRKGAEASRASYFVAYHHHCRSGISFLTNLAFIPELYPFPAARGRSKEGGDGHPEERQGR
jgi:hypothetical protein